MFFANLLAALGIGSAKAGSQPPCTKVQGLI